MSRRDQIRMTDEEVDAFLKGKQTIIINSIGKDGVPHPMPMWFGIEDDGAIVMTTFKKSQKIRNLQRDPRVSLLGEDGTEYSQLRGVVIYAEAEMFDDPEQVADVLVRVTKRSNPDLDAAPEQLREGVMGTAKKRMGIRIPRTRVVSWDHRKLGGVY